MRKSKIERAEGALKIMAKDDGVLTGYIPHYVKFLDALEEYDRETLKQDEGKEDVLGVLKEIRDRLPERNPSGKIPFPITLLTTHPTKVTWLYGRLIIEDNIVERNEVEFPFTDTKS